jgi:hypothetical protein
LKISLLLLLSSLARILSRSISVPESALLLNKLSVSELEIFLLSSISTSLLYFARGIDIYTRKIGYVKKRQKRGKEDKGLRRGILREEGENIGLGVGNEKKGGCE